MPEVTDVGAAEIPLAFVDDEYNLRRTDQVDRRRRVDRAARGTSGDVAFGPNHRGPILEAGRSQEMQPVAGQRLTLAAGDVDGHVDREPTVRLQDAVEL